MRVQTVQLGWSRNSHRCNGSAAACSTNSVRDDSRCCHVGMDDTIRLNEMYKIDRYLSLSFILAFAWRMVTPQNSNLNRGYSRARFSDVRFRIPTLELK